MGFRLGMTSFPTFYGYYNPQSFKARNVDWYNYRQINKTVADRLWSWSSTRNYLVAGSFHLLHLMFDEYVMYTIEDLQAQAKAEKLLKAATGNISDGNLYFS